MKRLWHHFVHGYRFERVIVQTRLGTLWYCDKCGHVRRTV